MREAKALALSMPMPTKANTNAKADHLLRKNELAFVGLLFVTTLTFERDFVVPLAGVEVFFGMQVALLLITV